jgi:hypothetical protein
LVSLANHHYTNFSITIITMGWHNRPIGGRSAEWTQLDSTAPLYQCGKKIKPVPFQIQNRAAVHLSVKSNTNYPDIHKNAYHDEENM